jgi:hypothetical protein
MTPGTAPAPAHAPTTGVPTGPLTAASWLLRIAVLLHAAGKFASVFTMRHTQFGNYLFLEIFDQRYPVADPYLTAVFVEKITVSLYLLAGLVVLVKPWWPLLLLMSGYALAEAVTGTLNAGYRFSEWTVPAHALRYGAPLFLLALAVSPPFRLLERWRLPVTRELLRIAIAVVFVTHGLHALLADPQFIDMIIGTGRRLLGIRVTEANAVLSLKVIAIVDFAAALMLLIYPVPMFVPRRFWAEPCAVCPIRRVILPLLLSWVALWGLVTAAARMTSLGWSAGLPQYPELLDRASHFLAPLALWCLYRAQARPAACGDAAQSPQAANATLLQTASEKRDANIAT